MGTRAVSPPNWTWAGLALALLGLPAITFAFRGLVPNPGDGAIAVRELAIFALTGVLLWMVLRGERRGLDSIGLGFGAPWRSLGRGFALTLLLFLVLSGTLAAFSALGLSYGAGPAIAPSLPVVLVTVLRAGICEEILYRGYAIERLGELTGSRWAAAAISLALFAGFHIRQGVAGVLLTLILGAMLTAFYLLKRDLFASIIAHFLVDAIPNVIMPLLAGDGA